MTKETSQREATEPVQPEPKKTRKSRPEWSSGLRQLYDSVVNEPLPDSFADLLSKLDESGK
jgi:hypothetical protein